MMMAAAVLALLLGAAQQRPDASADLASLKLSEACAEAAEKFWRREGFDKPRPPSDGDTYSYTSHYNTRAKKCYVAVNIYTIMAGGAHSQLEEVNDAIEGVLIAEMHSYAKAALDELKPDFLTIHGVVNGSLRGESITPENLALFRRLMTE